MEGRRGRRGSLEPFYIRGVNFYSLHTVWIKKKKESLRGVVTVPLLPLLPLPYGKKPRQIDILDDRFLSSLPL
jgi:hypothetical protein